MTSDQEYINKAKELFDNIEVFVMGKTRLIKEMYYDVVCNNDLGNSRSIERFVVFRMVSTVKIENIPWADILTSKVLFSIISHYPSLDVFMSSALKKKEDGQPMFRIFVSFTSLDTVSKNLSLADGSLPIPERRSIMIVPDGGQPKLVGVSTYAMTKALELFKFPPNHPIANTAYAMVDVYPDHYVPLAGFHEHYKQTKHAAFIELCASLGAKEICIENAEINEQTLDIDADIKKPLAKLGLGINIRENHETGQKIAFKFSEANRAIKDFDSP